MAKKWRETTNVLVEIMNSKRKVMAKLGHVVQFALAVWYERDALPLCYYKFTVGVKKNRERLSCFGLPACRKTPPGKLSRTEIVHSYVDMKYSVNYRLKMEARIRQKYYSEYLQKKQQFVNKRTSLMWIPKGRSEVSVLERCPYKSFKCSVAKTNFNHTRL